MNAPENSALVSEEKKIFENTLKWAQVQIFFTNITRKFSLPGRKKYMKAISQNLSLKSPLSWSTNHDYLSLTTFNAIFLEHISSFTIAAIFIFHISLLYKTPSLHTSLTVNCTPRYVCSDLLVGPRAAFEGHRIIVVLLQDTSCITTKQDGKAIVAVVGGNIFCAYE